jgi:hypothetical protein
MRKESANGSSLAGAAKWSPQWIIPAIACATGFGVRGGTGISDPVNVARTVLG